VREAWRRHAKAARAAQGKQQDNVQACRSQRIVAVHTREEGGESNLWRKTRAYTHEVDDELIPRRRTARSRSRWREEDTECRWMVPLRELRVEARDGQGEAWQVSGV